MLTKGRSCAEPDTWCWVVAFAAFWVNFCLLGVVRSSAVVFVALIEAFHVTRETAAWPSGIFGFSMCVTGILAGYLSHHLSIRSIMIAGSILASFSVSLCCIATNITHITILYGACQGVGIGIIVPLTHVILNRYFQCYRAVAMGIAYAGSSAGSFLFPPLAQWLLGEFGLNGTFLLLGGIMLQSLMGVAFMRSPKTGVTQESVEIVNDVHGNSPMEMQNTVTNSSTGGSSGIPKKDDSGGTPGNSILDQTRKNTLEKSCLITVDVLTNFDFLLISAVFAVYFSVSAIFLMVILDFSLEKLMSKEQGVFLVSMFSFGDLAGRLLCGWIGDVRCVKRNAIVCCYLWGMSVFLMTLPLCWSYELLSTISVLLGLLNGGVIVNYSALLTELLGLKNLPIALGFSSSIIGITAFLRPLVIGYFRDQNQSYDILFVALGALQMTLTTVWLLKTTFARKERKFS